MRKLYNFLLATVILLSGSVTAFAFDIRCMHIDMRTEVMTIDALKKLADKAAQGGINAIMMEWEATFPFEENSTICNDEAYTRDEVKEFVSHCASLGIDVIPLQNCFGHSEYILRHERYASIRESKKDFSQVCPSEVEKAKKIFRSIFAEIVALHPSKYIHIGGDETRLLGVCKKCASKVKKDGKSKLFCDYVIAMCELAREFGKTPIIWADILTKYPEHADRLPKDLILLDWNYGWDINKFGDFRKIASAGFPMWGAPALRSSPDDIHTTQWMKHFNNLRDYVPFVRDLGFKGIVETSWSTSGVYGYIYSAQSQAFEIQPVRQVYPLSAFGILQAAFCEAASSDKPFEPEDFIRRYCSSNYGFDSEGQDAMLAYFNLRQSVIPLTKPSEIELELSDSEAVLSRLASLKPKANKEEIEHFRLMLAIRVNYLKFRLIESEYESSSFKASDKARLASALKPVLKETLSLQKRFCKLNEGYLKHPERAFNDWTYIGHMKNILRNLENRI
ncbi:MAG: family 20 glycosylhydrolase [Bacteroidales bacterium]|nr:family 20 glycosylhydrolase [Bacteroidales bacterium]MDY3783925.1 family 20 glycosylhydrolase [Candidatus Cryptobacteroides sp.]